MASSGMVAEPEKIIYEGEQERWQHLADLVEFGFALRDTLETINQQSFNHFIMKIGQLFNMDFKVHVKVI